MIKPKNLIIPLLIITIIFSAGCINPQSTETEIPVTPDEQNIHTGILDKPLIRYPPDCVIDQNHKMSFNWVIDMHNSTGFESVSVRSSSSNRVPIFVANPDTQGIIPIKITAGDKTVSISLGNVTHISDGMNISLEDETLTVNAGETVNANLIVNVSESARNEESVTLVELISSNGWSITNYCMLYSSADENRPDI